MEKITMESFSTAYPDLFAEIQKVSFGKGFSEGEIKGKLSGAESERLRIKSVEDQLIPGHEVLIASLKFDGKTTGPEAAVQILQKEKDLRKTKNEDLLADAEKTKILDPAAPVGDARGKVDPEKQIETYVKEIMEKDPKISYMNALDKAQREHMDLAQKILERLTSQREKTKE